MISKSKKEYNRTYYQRNRERLLAAQKLYYERHWDEIADYRHSRYPLVRERDLARLKIYHQEHRQERAAYSKRYYEAHRAEIARKHKAWVKANYAHVLEKNNRYAHENRDKVNAWTRAWCRKNRPKLAAYEQARRLREDASRGDSKLLSAFYLSVRSKKSVACYYCGKRLRGKDAHIDHVIALSKGGNHAVENLAVSCPTCNHSKCAKLPHEWPKHPQMFLTL